VAIAVLPVIVIPLLAFAGFYINKDSLPIYFYPLKLFSYFGYAFEASAINEWSRVGHIAGCTELRKQNSTHGTGTTTHCYKDGNDVLDSLSFHTNDFYRVRQNNPTFCTFFLLNLTIFKLQKSQKHVWSVMTPP